MAPEQVRGEVADHRADIFSLGVVLAEMATGTHPFGRGPSLRVMSAILADEPKLEESGSAISDHWTKDGTSVLVYRSVRDTVRIDAIHLVSGERTLWKELHPHDSAGILSINPITIAADDESYAYGFRRMLSETYIVDGLM